MFECNKLHGFLRMNDFVDKNYIPCVRSKVIDANTVLKELSDEYFTIKIVKENTSCCVYKESNCEECINFDCLYKDYGLDIKKRIKKEDFAEWINFQKEKDPDYIFYFYKYFDSNSFGKLIISKNYYTIEAVDGKNTNLCLESNTLWRGTGIINKMDYFSDTQIEELISYGKIIKEKMNLYIESDYSIIMDFAFTDNHYFGNETFPGTNLLFYGLRTAYNRTDLENIYYISY